MKIGFIGLGNVGGKLAGSLQRNGFDLTVRDLDRSVAEPFLAKRAVWADSPKTLAEATDLVITCLPSPAASSEVMEATDGVIAGLGPGKMWLEMSTTDEAEVRRLGAVVEGVGAMPMDGPVSGGCHRAATGNISIFVGGERAAFEKALPALKVMGRRILHVGPLGSASILKVVTNYLCSVHLVALGEAMMVAKQAGMDLNTAFEAIRISSGNSFVHETESQVILNGSYNINFTMDLVVKDMSLFDGLAKRLHVPLELSPIVLDIFKDGQARYGARAWSPMIVKRLEDACGSDLRAAGFPEEIVDDEPEEPGAEVVVAGGTKG
ncbi:MAG: NAD(P)-dependent oxidoreductase [Acidiferrobacterales bacterium]